VFVHAPYLVNIGSPAPLTVEKSVDALRHALRRGRAIGARGVVVHAGSEVATGTYDVAMTQVRERLLPLLDGLDDDDPDVLVELTAGAKGSLAATPDQLGAYLDALDHHPKVGVCVDTCHAMASGHDLAAPGGLRSFLSAVVKVVGRGRLRLVHANDSKDPAGSGRDRHQNLGAGEVGVDALRRMIGIADAPVVCETPGGEAAMRADVEFARAAIADE